MVKSPFVWLGAGRARKRGVAGPAALLDEIARAGLPVPAGAVLLDELYQIFLNEGVIVRDGAQVVVPDAQWLLEVLYRDVRLPRLPQPVVMRNAGAGAPDLCVAVPDMGQPSPVAEALARIWTAQVHGAERQDVLLLEQVRRLVGGTAVIGSDADAIEYTAGDGAGQRLELPHLRAFQGADQSLPPHAQRLQKLLRGLRRTLGEGPWQIAWSDDGQICWVTAAKR